MQIDEQGMTKEFTRAFQVNHNADDRQVLFSIASLSEKTFVIVWWSRSNSLPRIQVWQNVARACLWWR